MSLLTCKRRKRQGIGMSLAIPQNPNGECGMAFDPHGQQAMVPFRNGQPVAPYARNPADNYDPSWQPSPTPACGTITLPNPVVTNGQGGFQYMSGDPLNGPAPEITYTEIAEYQAPDGFGKIREGVIDASVGYVEPTDAPDPSEPEAEAVPDGVVNQPAPTPTPNPAPTVPAPDSSAPQAPPQNQYISVNVTTPKSTMPLDRQTTASARKTAELPTKPSSSNGSMLAKVAGVGVLLWILGRKKRD